MKKIIMAVGLVALLTGCNSKNESIDNVNEESGQLEMTYGDYVQFLDKDFKNDDWSIGIDDTEEHLMLVYEKYYLDLHKAKKYADLDSFKNEWIDFTNTINKTTQKYCVKLAELGFKGKFGMSIQDSYGEIMYLSAEDGWIDNVFETQGSGER